jgi:GT2 family glycosyltransferase
MKTSVVIVSYNTKKLLQACLETVIVQTPRPEVIVVDNGSHDGSPELVEQNYRAVKLIKNTRNLGFAAANNQAFHEVTGDVIVMLNSDTELPAPTTLEALATQLSQHPEVGVVAPRLINGQGEVQASVAWTEPTLLTTLYEYTLLNRLLYKVFASRRYPGKLLLTAAEMAHPQSVGDAIGACLAFRRTLLTEVGLLDERFFFFLEETDFNLRVRRAGYKIQYLPEHEVIHHWGGSVDKAGTLTKRFSHYFPSLYAFYGKYHSGWYVSTQKAIASIGSATIVGLSGLLLLPGKVSRKYNRSRLAQVARNQRALYKQVLDWHVRGSS